TSASARESTAVARSGCQSLRRSLRPGSRPRSPGPPEDVTDARAHARARLDRKVTAVQPVDRGFEVAAQPLVEAMVEAAPHAVKRRARRRVEIRRETAVARIGAAQGNAVVLR